MPLVDLDDMRRVLAVEVMGWTLRQVGALFAMAYFDGDKEVCLECDWHPDLDDAQCGMVLDAYTKDTGCFMELYTDYTSNWDSKGWWCRIGEEWDNPHVRTELPTTRRLASCLAIYRAVKAGKEQR